MDIQFNNPNAMTGKSYVFGLDMDRKFYSSDVIGAIDAPEYIVSGSFTENIIDSSRISEINGRYIISSIQRR